ncbi:cyclase [Allokutzneria oryzae]|uniref:Cyclase n=1 Tax=Allokutzneria oryzae TaxID=1378989 RepID=A0ABV6A7X0_9PSEU
MSPASRIAFTATVATASLIALALPAAAAPVTFTCEASTPIGKVSASLNQEVTASAPATVAAGGDIAIVVDPAPNKVPAKVGDYTLKEVKNFALKIPVPANSTYVSASLSGGSGVGTATVSHENGTLVLKLSGALAGGADFELPTVTVNLKAGASGTISSKLGGTSFSDPGLTFTATAQTIIGPINAPTACYPNPNPALTTTTIG